MNDCITTTKQSTTKPCAYFLGYTVSVPCPSPCWPRAPAARHRVTWPWGPYWLFLPNSDPVGTPVSSKISPNVETDELVTRKVPHFRWAFLITVTAKSPTSCLFVQQLVRANIRGNINAEHYWSFVRGIYRWPVDSPQKGPVIRTLSWRQYEWEGGGVPFVEHRYDNDIRLTISLEAGCEYWQYSHIWRITNRRAKLLLCKVISPELEVR